MTAPPTAPPRRARGWDIALTVVLWLALSAVGLWGSAWGLLALAFLDQCPPTGCDGSEVYLRWLATVVGWLVVTVVGTVLLAVRRRGWWVALVGLVGVSVLWAPFLLPSIAYDLGLR